MKTQPLVGFFELLMEGTFLSWLIGHSAETVFVNILARVFAFSWAEDLWLHHFLPQIESSVEEQVADASNGQQDLLIQVALKAFLEGAFLPGCPCRLDIEQ